MSPTRCLTAAAMKKASKPRERHPLPTYTITRAGVTVFTGTIGKVREFLGMTGKNTKDSLRYRLDNGITDEAQLKAPPALTQRRFK
jgi:hypothetical protein